MKRLEFPLEEFVTVWDRAIRLSVNGRAYIYFDLQQKSRLWCWTTTSREMVPSTAENFLIVVTNRTEDQIRRMALSTSQTDEPDQQPSLPLEASVHESTFDAVWSQIRPPDGQPAPLMSREQARFVVERYLVARHKTTGE